jgi:hypothetical protein
MTSNVKNEHFAKQTNAPLVMNSINTSLSCLGDRSVDLTQKLWQAVDTEVGLTEWFFFKILIFISTSSSKIISSSSLHSSSSSSQ